MKELSTIFLSLTLVGFGWISQAFSEGSMKEDGYYPPAFAYVKGMAEGSNISGKIKFYETEDGLKAVAHLSGVEPSGKHGIHIHENGSCDDMGKAAGGHYNPHGTEHGFLPDDGLENAHAGDMGNIVVDEDGHGILKADLPGLSLEDDNAVMGRAVILHEKEDDFGQPTGNAGGRIGCGIIVSAKKSKALSASMNVNMKASMKDSGHEKHKGY